MFNPKESFHSCRYARGFGFPLHLISIKSILFSKYPYLASARLFRKGGSGSALVWMERAKESVSFIKGPFLNIR